MKNKQYYYIIYGSLIISIITLFLINPYFENKYRNAEGNVQILKNKYRPEYDSLVRKYNIQFELMNFMNDSAENVINQKFMLLKHTIKMQKLNVLISEDEYQRRLNEIWDLEIAEYSTVRDSFVQRLLRLDYPKEMKVPLGLSKKVALYQVVDKLIGFTKWFILVVAIVVFIIDYFKKTQTENNFGKSPIKNIQLHVSSYSQMQYNSQTLTRRTDLGETKTPYGEFWFNENEEGVFVPDEVIREWEKQKVQPTQEAQFQENQMK